jgi:hypothetical protein
LQDAELYAVYVISQPARTVSADDALAHAPPKLAQEYDIPLMASHVESVTRHEHEPGSTCTVLEPGFLPVHPAWELQ